MARNVMGLIVGLAAAFFVYWSLQSINQSIAPVPEGLSTEDKEAMIEYFRSIPTSAHLIVLASYVLGAFFGGWVAGKIGERFIRAIPITIGGFLLLMAILKLVMTPHPYPIWFSIVGIIVHVPFAFWGYKLARD